MSAGRPTKMTQETIDKLEFAFSLGCTDLEACIHADISDDCLYKYQRENPEFIKRKERLKSKVVLKAKINLDKELENGNYDATKFVLERKDPEYKPKSNRELSGEITYKTLLEQIMEDEEAEVKDEA